MFTGYILYLVVGVVAVAVTAIFYFYIEGVMGKLYSGLPNYLAWGHYVLMNIGVAGSMILMIWGGYMAGYAGTAVSSGGLGYTDYQIHIHYLSQSCEPDWRVSHPSGSRRDSWRPGVHTQQDEVNLPLP